MAGNKKPKKKYNPNKLRDALTGAPRPAPQLKMYKPLTESDQQVLMYHTNEAMNKIASKTGTSEHWFTVFTRIEFSVMVAKELGYDEEVIKELEAGCVACKAMHARNNLRPLGTPWVDVLDEEIETISACVEAADELQKEAAKSDLLIRMDKGLFELIKSFPQRN